MKTYKIAIGLSIIFGLAFSLFVDGVVQVASNAWLHLGYVEKLLAWLSLAFATFTLSIATYSFVRNLQRKED